MPRPCLLPFALPFLALGSCAPGNPVAAAAPQAEHEQSSGARLEGARVSVPSEEREHLGLVLARPETMRSSPEVLVFGRVVPDPAARATLRAPVAGTLLAGDVELAPGTAVEAGGILLRLRPRWTPTERLDLEARLAAARSELAAVQAELPARRAAGERARALHDLEDSVSAAELEDAQARLTESEARLESTRALVALLERTSAQDGSATAPLELRAPLSGELVEVLARAGEAVEAGAELCTTEDFGTPLLELDLPVDGAIPTTVASARLALPGMPDLAQGMQARRVGLAPRAGGGGLAPSVLFRMPPDSGLQLRPGQVLSAWLPSGEPERTGLLIPSAAVVRLAGTGFVYVDAGDETLERRSLPLEHPVPGGWFVQTDWAPEPAPELVVVGAQTVLALELLGRQGTEEED